MTDSGRAPDEFATHNPSYAGYRWRLTQLTTPTESTAIPRNYLAAVSLFPDGMFVLRGPINTLSGRYLTTQSGFIPDDLATTLIQYAGADPMTILINTAFAFSVWEGNEVEVISPTDHTLILSVGSYRMSFDRIGSAERY
jgi:hypothetical protein